MAHPLGNPEQAKSGNSKNSIEESFAEEIVDRNVVAQLPEGVHVTQVRSISGSAWVETFCIVTASSGGLQKKYFLKSDRSELAKRMMEGNFESERLVYECAPQHVPRPVAWGCYRSNPKTWFFLSDFVDFKKHDPEDASEDGEDAMPDKTMLVEIVAGIHTRSMGKSPTGKYGFHAPTHLANLPIDNTWQETWEAWYAQALRRMFELEEKTHGQDDEIDYLKKQLFDKVIPRLLRPLEDHIKPCLVPGDIWRGNIKFNEENGKVSMFDSCAFWGHCEADMGAWRADRHKMHGYREAYMEKAKEEHLKSQPRYDEWQGRNLLYGLRYDLVWSAQFPENPSYRQLAMRGMRELLEKYGDGLVAESGK